MNAPFRWAVFAVYSGLVLYFSLRPMPDEVPGEFDKLYHLMAYAVMGFLLSAALSGRQRPGLLRSVAAVAAVFAFGAAVEYLQSFTGYRSPDAADAAFNGAGGILGAAAFSLVASRLSGRLGCS